MTILELDRLSVLNTLPDRDPFGHKGTFGNVLLLCGSRGFTGAAYLAAMGALRAGAGLVYLGVPESIYAIEAVKLNEPVVFPLPEEGGKLSAEAIPQILERLPAMDAVLLGCGLGVSEGTLAVVRAVLENRRDGLADYFDAHPEKLRQSCLALNAEPIPGGDMGYAVELFDGLKIGILFWAGDEEFTPRFRYLWDENADQYIRYKTMFYAVDLRESAAGAGGGEEVCGPVRECGRPVSGGVHRTDEVH